MTATRAAAPDCSATSPVKPDAPVSTTTPDAPVAFTNPDQVPGLRARGPPPTVPGMRSDTTPAPASTPLERYLQHVVALQARLTHHDEGLLHQALTDHHHLAALPLPAVGTQHESADHGAEGTATIS